MPLPVTLSDILFVQPQPPPFKIGGRFYILAVDSSTATNIKMIRADGDDPTDAWTELNSAGRPILSGVVTRIAAVVDGTTIHIITHDANLDLRYHSFRADGTNDDWVITDETIVSGVFSIATSLGIGVRSDGDVLVVYPGDIESVMGADWDRAYIARREGGSWTVDIRVDAIGKVEKDIQVHSGIIADQTNDRFHVAYVVVTDSDLFVSTYRSDNSFHASGQDISIDATVGTSNIKEVSDVVSFDDGGTLKIRGLYEDSDNDLNSFGFDDSDTPSPSTTADINDAGNIANASLAVDGNLQHALFQESTDTTIIRHDETGAGDDTWGTDDDELDTAGAMVVFAANVYSQGGTVLAYLYTEGGTEKYNERSLSSTTPVSDTLDIRWDIIIEVQDTLDIRWDMAGQVSDTLDLRWNLFNEVQDTLDIRWNLFNEVQDTLDIRWDIIIEVQDTLDIRWDMAGQVSDTLDIRWDIISEVQDMLDLRWNLFNEVQDTLDLRWNLFNEVQDTLDIRWNLFNEVQDTLDIRWDIIADISSIQDTMDIRWNLFNEIQDTLDIRWNLFNDIQNTLDIRWDLFNEIQDILNIHFNIILAGTPIASEILVAKDNTVILVSKDISAKTVAKQDVS